MKTLFHKWRSIENLDDFIAEGEMKRAAPEARYIVTEKLDGSNLQIAWDRESGTLSFFTRNGNSPFETVKGFESFVPTTDDLATLARRLAAAHPEATAVGWYGELIGSKAMNRLCYCKELQVRLFHFYWEAGDVIHHTSFPELEAQLKDAGLLQKYGIPILGTVTLKELVGWKFPNWKSAFPTAVGFEGVVFHPAEPESWARRIFKWKTPEFREVAKPVAKHKTAEEKALADHIKSGQEIFSAYINENRAYSVQSKMGVILTKDIAKATAALLADAKEDFLKDHPEYVGDEARKAICNVGNAGYLIIRKLAFQNEENA